MVRRQRPLHASVPRAHERRSLRGRDRRRRRRARLSDRPTAEPVPVDLWSGVRRAVRDRLPPRVDRSADRDPRAEALRVRAIRRGERARSARVRRRHPEGASPRRARRDRRVRSGGHGVRPRSGDLRVPPGGVRGPGPSWRDDGARHPSVPPAPRRPPRRDPSDLGHGGRAANGSGPRTRLLARLAQGRGLRLGVPGCRLHARPRPEHPGCRARRRAPRRRLPAEREPRVPGRARRRRPRDRRRERRARCGPHRPPRDRGRRAPTPDVLPPADDQALEGAVTQTLDVARVAKRLGARRVRVVALESREEMPAHEFEIEEAELEGIEVLTRLGPKAILGDRPCAPGSRRSGSPPCSIPTAASTPD